jgi:hypothetical protein
MKAIQLHSLKLKNLYIKDIITYKKLIYNIENIQNKIQHNIENIENKIQLLEKPVENEPKFNKNFKFDPKKKSRNPYNEPVDNETNESIKKRKPNEVIESFE